MSEQVTFSSWLKGIADAIRNKKGTTDAIRPLDFASEIESISAGSGDDFDYEYTGDATLFHIEFDLPEDNVIYEKIGMIGNAYFTQSIANGVNIDWGDGSPIETSSSNSVSLTHTYSKPGKYTISLLSNNNCIITNLGYQEINGDVVLRGVNIGKNVESLNSYGFKYAKQLKHISFSNTVKSIPDMCFYESPSIEKLVLPNSITNLSGTQTFNNMFALKDVYIPNNITSFPSVGFDYCYTLKNVEFEEGCQLTTGVRFGRCYSLEYAPIPPKATSIPQLCFQYCYALKVAVFPKTVTSIGNKAFQYCTRLKVLDFSQHDSVPTLGTDVFINSSLHTPANFKGTILVKSSIYDQWVAASGWSTYANNIVAI